MKQRITQVLAPLALLAMTATCVSASNLYRAELLMFERLNGTPELVSGTDAIPLPEAGFPFWVNTDWQPMVPEGSALLSGTSAILTPPSIISLPSRTLRLARIARAIDNEPGYRLVALTGWDGEFAPGYRSQPLVVDLKTGADESHRIRGTMTLERRRYLHLDVNLGRMEALRPRFNVAPIPARYVLYPEPTKPVVIPSPTGFLDAQTQTEWITRTWMKELRRMRSEEVHYLDAPTFGVVVYFQPLRPDD